MRLIIPSAKVVPEELQKLGKLPAIIYPINQKITFDYLYEQYKDKTNAIDIICYENAGKVLRRLENFKDKNVNIKMLPQMGDLGYTIYCALDNVHEPIIINYADTIVMDSITDENEDSFFYQEDYLSETWTYFDEENGVIKDIYDKTAARAGTKKKLFVGVFKIIDSASFRACLMCALSDEKRQVNSFYSALQLYSQKHPMKAIQTDNWFDIGHEDEYYNSKIAVRAREFNHITIDKNRGILRKNSDDKDKFIGEIKWYLKLPSDVEYVRPRIFSYSTDYSKPYVSMEYYAYHTVHELFLNGDLDIHQWEKVFKRIEFIINDFKRYTVKDENIIPSLEDMYLIKTINRFDKIKIDKRFEVFFHRSIFVNGIKYLSLEKIINKLKVTIPEMLYDVKEFSIIHGDLCFANMMVDNNFSFIKVIDPRGKFGSYDIYGDPRYELAKLFHSVDGKYDYIIKDLFDLEYKDGSISFSIQDKDRDFDLYQVFINVFKDDIGNNLKKIELIEALLFLSMIPLHGESFEHQLVMLGTGLEILNRVVNIEEN